MKKTYNEIPCVVVSECMDIDRWPLTCDGCCRRQTGNWLVLKLETGSEVRLCNLCKENFDKGEDTILEASLKRAKEEARKENKEMKETFDDVFENDVYLSFYLSSE